MCSIIHFVSVLFVLICHVRSSCITSGSIACAGKPPGGTGDTACSHSFWICGSNGQPVACFSCPNDVSVYYWNTDTNSCAASCATTTTTTTTISTTTTPPTLLTYELCATNGTASFNSGSAQILITSPGYPRGQYYPNNADCAFYIQTSVATSVSSLAFNTEAYLDVLTITNVYTGRAGSYYGTSTVSQTLDSALYLFQFTSDSSVTRSGFALLMSQQGAGTPTTNTTPRRTTPTTNSSSTPVATTPYSSTGVNICAVRLASLQNGAINLTSPGYPNNYANGLSCTIQVVGAPGGIIRVKTLNFLTENAYDYLEVVSYTGANLGQFSGSGGPNFASHSDYLNFTFHSDGSINTRGFIIQISQPSLNTTQSPVIMSTIPSSNSSGNSTYPVVPCNSNAVTYTLSNFNQGFQITTPNYPGSYPNDAFCGWSFQNNNPDPSTRIALEISTFTTEGCCDSLQIIGGNFTAMYSGMVPPTTRFLPNIGVNNSYSFLFQSDGSINAAGFQAFLYLG